MMTGGVKDVAVGNENILNLFLISEESSTFNVRTVLNPRETKKMLDKEETDEEMWKG